jgi:hypothetical protein
MSNDDWLLLSIFFYLLVCVTVVVYAVGVKKARVFDPIVQFFIFLTLFVIPLPLRAYMTKQIEGDVTEHLAEILPYMPLAVFMTAVSLPLFVWGYYSGFAERLASRLPYPRTGPNLRAASLFLGVLSIFLLIQLARSTDGLINFLLLGYGASAEIYGKGHLAIGFPWLFIASMFLLYRYAVGRKRFDLGLFVVTYLLLNGGFLLMGSRNMIMYMGLTVALFWHYAVRPIPLKKLAAFGLLSFLALNIVGYLRASNYQSVSDFWTESSSAYKETSNVKGRMLYTLTVGEFVVPFETLPQMIRSVGNDIRPEFGFTYIKDALLWIPSVLFPDRPPSLTHWYMETFYGEGHWLNVGRSFFFLSEGYLNFGFVGLLATMFAWGLFFGVVHRYMVANKGEPGAMMLCALTIAFMYRGIAGDFSSIFVSLPEQSVSAAVLGMWIANLGSKKKLWEKGLFISRASGTPIPGQHRSTSGILQSRGTE